MYRKETLIFASDGHSNYRIPSIVASRNGTVFAFCNNRKESLADHAEEVALVYSRKKAGEEWEPVRELLGIPAWACSMGSAVYDGVTDVVMCSGTHKPKPKDEFGSYTKAQAAQLAEIAEKRALELGKKTEPFMISSADGGETWQEHPMEIAPFIYTCEDGTTIELDGSCHGSEHGIQLRHGAFQGRLLCPARTQIGAYDTWEGLRKCVCNNAIYSDDHGKTWKASAPVQIPTGEGTLMEHGDGTITYNSRAYFQDQKRYLATSTDGGATYGDFRSDDFLIEEKEIGCNASLLRVEREELRDGHLLPKDADAITIFVNPRSAKRENMTACVSFDDGKSWKKTKTIYEGPCAYSSLAFSKADQCFYLMYEKGTETPYDKGIAVAAFDLEWLMMQHQDENQRIRRIET